MTARIYSNISKSKSVHPIQNPTIERLDKIIELINLQNTGGPNELAQQVGLKKARLMQLMRMIKETGVEVNYDRIRKTYHFVQNKKFILQCRIVEKG